MRKLSIPADDYAAQLALVWSVVQAAERLGVTDERVKQFIGDGRLPAKRIGRDWVICRLAVEQLASAKRQPGRPPAEMPQNSAPPRKQLGKLSRRGR